MLFRSAGQVYPCYMSVAELDALREQQMAAKLKPRYDGTWRPEPGKALPPIPEGVQPVWRFKNPVDGVVAWDDKVKGRIEIANAELDDLVIARPDGTPTYNFCVVVDDIDMAITHVIRGDDHVEHAGKPSGIAEGEMGVIDDVIDFPPLGRHREQNRIVPVGGLFRPDTGGRRRWR